MKETVLSKNLGNGRVQCLACSWKCKIKENQRGICGVRENSGGKLWLLVYERAAAVGVDPIEKKPFYHFLPGKKALSIGTYGCNLGCDFCQNYSFAQATKGVKRFDWGEKLSASEAVEFCKTNKLSVIAFTYNEPTIFAEYAVDVMEAAKKENIKGVFVSNGFESKETLDYLDGFIEAYNIDLKSFSEFFYRDICKAKLKPVLETIEQIHKRKKWLEIASLLIPGKNDSKEEIKGMAKFIKKISADIPWHITAFSPTYRMTTLEPTPQEKLFEAYEIGKSEGLNYVYTGNIWDNKYNNTICPKCGFLMIERDTFYNVKDNSSKGKCSKCGFQIPGIWE